MVSIIVPVYNAEQRLPACIESILAQSFRDFELILINDGSPDGCLEICRRYERQDSRVRVLDQAIAGVSRTRNRGIENARGEYVEFVDSDDCIAPDMVEKLVKALESAHADLAVCGILRRFPDHEETITPLISGTVEVSRLQEQYPTVFSNFALHSPVNKLYRREKIREFFSPALSFGEDCTFNLAYLRTAERIVFLQENLYYYLDSPTSLIRTFRPDRLETAQWLYRNELEFCRSVGLTQPATRDLSRNLLDTVFYALGDLYCTTDRTGAEKRRLMTAVVGSDAVRQALDSVEMPQRKQHLAQQLLRHNHLTAFHLMLSAQARLRRHSARS